MSRAFEIKESSCYYGHGLAIEAIPAINHSELDILKEENKQLREQLQYQQQQLSIWQQAHCTICQTLSNTFDSTSNSSTNSRSSRISRSFPDAAANPSNSSAVHDCLDKAFRQQQVLIAQLQRQVMIMEVELSSREQLVSEADVVLAECSRKLSALLTLQDGTVSPGSGISNTNRPTVRSTTIARSATSTGQRPGSRPSHTSLQAADLGVSKSSIPAAASNQVLEQAQLLFTWCKSSAARISRARAQSAARCRAARDSSFAANRAANGQSNSSTHWEAGDQEGPSTLQQLQLQYAPAGGNRFTKQGAALGLPQIAAGQGLSALNAAALRQLIPQLAGLAHSLANLSVQLRSIILPALPWVAAAVGEELISSTAAVAESAAAAAGLLVEACSVLPAVAGTLSQPAAAAARNRLVKTAMAAREAGDWDSAVHTGKNTATEQLGADADAQELMQLDPGDVMLLEQIADLGGISGSGTKGKNTSDGKAATSGSIGRSSSAGGSITISPSRRYMQQQQQQQQALGADTLLHKLQQRWRVLWFKKQVLEQQLRFVATCSSEQAKLVSSLTHDVAAAVREAADAAEQLDDLQQRRLEAQQLVQQLMRAMLLLQQRPGEVAAAGSALRAVVGLLEQNVEVLQDIPKLLQVSSGPSVKAAALAALTATFQGFRSEVHGAQRVTDRLCKHMKSASAGSNQHMQA